MNRSIRLFWWLLWFGAVLSAVPAIAADPNAVLYEVTETMSVRTGRLNSRLAMAALSGTVDAGTSLCPGELAYALGIAKCTVNAIAHDNVDLATGRGPINGTFAVVAQDLNTTDGPEVVIVRGSVGGRIDLSPALLGPDGVPKTGDEAPLGGLVGSWSATGVPGGPMQGFSGHGTLTGTFRLPFVAPWDPTKTPHYLMNPLTGYVTPVRDDERALGYPTVRLEITFVDGSRWGSKRGEETRR
jgi:hypothetical protein